MTVMEIFRKRTVTAEQAASVIQTGQRVFLTGNCSVPQTVLRALITRAPELRDVEVVQGLTVGTADYVAPAMDGHLRVNTLFISDNVRKAMQEGRADFTPCFLSEIPGLFKNGFIGLDVALIHVSPPDEHGFCTLGVEVGVTKTAAQSARTVIAEVNPNMPRTLGDAFLHSFTPLFSLWVAYQRGDGRICRIFSVKSVHISAHFGPMAAERLYISILAGSIPTFARSFFAYSILRPANLLPSR